MEYAGVVLSIFLLIAVVDSFHFRPLLPPSAGAQSSEEAAYSTRTLSLLDLLLSGPREAREKTYSIPLGTHQFSKESMQVDGKTVRDFPRLQYGGRHLKETQTEWADDIIQRSASGLLCGLLIAIGGCWLITALRARAVASGIADSWRAIWQSDSKVPWRAILITATALALAIGWISALWPHYHVLGTDQTGNDILFQAIKSIRTAVVIGSLATIATLPLAIIFGILAGYYKGRVDDAIQYIYTVLSSIPSVLLISAFVLMIQVFIDKNPQLFETGLERADIRLFLLAAILGITRACCGQKP
jgi:peptide/nickel transport system permease protein